MIRVAIVEDDPVYCELLESYVARYGKEENLLIQVTPFSDGLEIAERYSAAFDIIFMDIQMKHLDGMDTARRIRQSDSSVVIIFITSLAQFALQGYQVEALSYVLKPVSYFAFAQEMKKAIRKIKGKSALFLHLFQDGKMVRLDVSDIFYIESQDHNVLYHAVDGSYQNRETLRSVEEKLTGRNFSRCNHSYLVNLAYVEKVEQNQVVVGGVPLRISRTRKKAFMDDLAGYIGKR